MPPSWDAENDTAENCCDILWRSMKIYEDLWPNDDATNLPHLDEWTMSQKQGQVEPQSFGAEWSSWRRYQDVWRCMKWCQEVQFPISYSFPGILSQKILRSWQVDLGQNSTQYAEVPFGNHLPWLAQKHSETTPGTSRNNQEPHERSHVHCCSPLHQHNVSTAKNSQVTR